MGKKKLTLSLAHDLDLPGDAVTQTYGFIGRKGSGKTYAAGVLVEEMLEHQSQVVVLDPVGNWYGLRLSASGKSPGYEIPLFGGMRGDLPLEVGAGALLADVIVDRGVSAIVDVSHFRKKQRKEFVADFAEQLFQRKKAAPSAIQVVLEEAQVFAPQRPGRGEERMLGAIEDIVRLGRNYGIGAALISQRPQSVNKEVLNQIECLVVLQLNGKHERKAIEEWVRYQGLDIREMVDSLPSLPQGQGYVWSPQWLGILERVNIRKKRTFDASATPEVGVKRVEPRQLAPLELEEIQSAMAEIVEQARANDPKALQKRIAELERELAMAETREPDAEPVPVFGEDDRIQIELLRTAVVEEADEIRSAFRDAASRVTALQEYAERNLPPLYAAAERAGAARQVVAAVNRKLRKTTRPPPARAPDMVERVKLKRGAVEMLKAAVSLGEVTRSQIATLAGLSPTSGTFSTYLGHLRKGGYLVEEGDTLRPTTLGVEYLDGDVPDAPASTAELLELWSAKLKLGARRMLAELVARYPEVLTRDDLAEAVEMSPSSGTFSTYLGHLRRNGLIDEPQRGEVRASDDLFPGAAR